MQVNRSNILRHFRGRRITIPLLALVVTLFLVFGGHKGIVSFAMDEMTGFLVGTDGVARDEVLAKAESPRASVSGVAEPPREAVPAKTPASEAPAISNAGLQLAQAEPGPAPTGRQVTAPTAAGQAAPSPVVEPVPPDSTVVRRQMRIYSATFLRDPFYSLVQAGKDRPAKLLDVGRAVMVGSVWGESGIIALLEDDTGRSFALKVGDRVLNGRVISVTPASITFSITVFGLSKTVTLELAEEGE